MRAALLIGAIGMVASTMPARAEPAAADPAPAAAASPPAAVASPAPAPRWIRGTDIQLMVTKEVNSRTSKAGDRVKLRVNSPVVVDNAIAIPVGASAWAEVINVSGTSAAGGSGRLSMRLLYVETRWGRVELSGTHGAEGDSNTGGVIMSVVGFGLLGLLARGGNATFKAGDIINGYIASGEAPVSEPLVIGN